MGMNLDKLSVQSPNGRVIVAKPDRGVQVLVRFPNGYGASIIQNEFSYGVEMAVVQWDSPVAPDDDFRLTMETPITDDVIGWLDSERATGLLNRIEALDSRWAIE